jgi:hypothetical protein
MSQAALLLEKESGVPSEQEAVLASEQFWMLEGTTPGYLVYQHDYEMKKTQNSSYFQWDANGSLQQP